MLVDYKRLICFMSAPVRKSNAFTCLSLPDCKCMTVFRVHNGAGKQMKWILMWEVCKTKMPCHYKYFSVFRINLIQRCFFVVCLNFQKQISADCRC